MHKTIHFGEIDYNRTGRRINAVSVEIRLDDGRLSICGTIWNSRHTDCLCGGQCLDEIFKYLHENALFREIYGYWKNWHLNDMRAGTRKQENAIREYRKTNPYKTSDTYGENCEYLKSIGLLTDNLADDEEFSVREGYKYGSGWVTWRIPEDVIRRIEEIING